jgi:hypothetical protein
MPHACCVTELAAGLALQGFYVTVMDSAKPGADLSSSLHTYVYNAGHVAVQVRSAAQRSMPRARAPRGALLWREIESAPNPLWSFGAGGWFQLVWGKEWYHRDVLWPGDSAYVRAMVSWRLDTMTTEVGVPELIFVRTPGKLDSAVLNEYASFAPEGRARASFENSRWY